MVAGVFIGLRGIDDHAVGIGVVQRLLGKAGVVDVALSLLDHAHTVVHRIHHRLGKVVHIGHEGIAHAQRHHHAVGALRAVVAGHLGGRVFRLAGAMAVHHLVFRVVIVFKKIPAGNVVNVAVVVFINAVAEDMD